MDSFWKGRKVFITGHTGFKGSWLTLWLTKLGANVTGYSLEPVTKPNLFDLCKIENLISSHIGDIRDLDKLASVIKQAEPEIIFHLAAQPLVIESYRNPVETYAVNVMGTVNILEAARHAEAVRSIINVTTDKVYENKEWVWPYRENDRLGGYDPYSNSKACSELVSSSFYSSFFSKEGRISLVTARAGNVIGGGDWAQDRLIPDIIRSFENKTKLTIRNPGAIRPWQHVLESLSGYLKVAEFLNGKPGIYKSLNFGPSSESFLTVEEILKIVKKRHPSFEYDQHASSLHEAQILKLDNSLAAQILNWHPRWNCSEAIEYTFDWYEDFMSGKNPIEVTMNQIEKFSKNRA